MSANRDRDEEIFDVARELAADERAAYLAERCGQDADLRQRIEGMLEADAAAGDFFKTHDGPLPTVILTDAGLSPSIEKAGDRIGRYKLLQQIGEGGCGVVYMAEQEEPVRRRVALKVIKIGMDTKQVIARFEAERQALALMDHPNIAKVLDAGATETGRPYFVMELVRGIKITEFCDENKLSTADRLKLFIQVCQAIQHAHQKGVIHRDIKPSNILVAAINDGVPVPKVIDFGIAKATAGRLTDQTLFTAFEQFLGTPAYMSPEQAVMTSMDIDTRSDIYSLGVLLYELLTGKTPFDAKELMAAGLDAMRRTIREQEPPKPSTRLGTMAADALTTTAKQHHTDAPKLVHALRGDLDWIAMKCLEKDRMRRYETASSLVSDIQRHLSNEPIVARPPSRLYRFQKSIHRNKLAYAGAAAIATVLLFGSVISTWQAIRATQAQREQKRLRDAAETARASETVARQQAEAAAKKSADVLSYIRDMVARAGNQYADRVTVLQMLDWSTNNAASQFQKQPDVSASVQFTLGVCYSRIGKWDQARSFLERALALQDQLYGYENLETLQTARELASVAFSQGRKEEAMTRYRKIMDSVKTASGKPQIGPDEKAGYRTLELWVCRKLAAFYLEEGQLAEARTFVTQRVKAAEGGELNDVEAGHAWSGAAELALAEGRLQEALLACDKEMSYYDTKQPVQRAWAEGMRGAVYLAMGDYAKAEPLITNSLPTLQKRFGESHFRVKRAFRDLVSLYTRTARPEMAAEWERRLAEPDKAAVEKEWPASAGSQPLAPPLVTPKPIFSTSAQLAARLPSRDPRARPELLDLTAAYNAALTDGWTDGNAENNLTVLPRGLQTFAGVEFDVRGLVQLRCSKSFTEPFPKEIKNIRVGRDCRKLHFLHAASCAWDTTNGTIIGQFFIHQSGLPAAEMPIRLGSDVRDWWVVPKQQPAGKDPATIAWAGTNGLGQPLQLFKTTWENPRPDVKVESLDYASSMSAAAPFLIAITLE